MTTGEEKGRYEPRTTTDAAAVLNAVRRLRDERDEARQVVGFHGRDLADLQRRIDRTVEYARMIRPLIRGEDAQGAFSVIIESLTTSLTTPAAKPGSGHV